MGDPSVTTADQLYGLDPKEFVAARTDLVRRLRAAGERSEAARVAKLRRPSVVAWALDRVARDRPGLIEAALAAGVGLRLATEAAVAGDAAALRPATAEDRAATNAVIDAVLAHVPAPDPSVRQQLNATLHVAVVDDDVAEELRRGVLAVVQESAGFGFGLDFTPAADLRTKVQPTPAPRAARSATRRDAQQRAEEKQARVAAEGARREQRKRRLGLEADVRRLTQRAQRLAADADRAEAEAHEARSRADAAVGDVDAARAALAAVDAEQG